MNRSLLHRSERLFLDIPAVVGKEPPLVPMILLIAVSTHVRRTTAGVVSQSIMGTLSGAGECWWSGAGGGKMNVPLALMLLTSLPFLGVC